MLFIVGMNLISEEPKKLLYADDLAVLVDSKEVLQNTLQELSNIFSKHGILMNIEKTDVMWTGEQDVELHAVVDGKTIKQVDSGVYLGGTVCEDGSGSRKVDGIAWDRTLS